MIKKITKPVSRAIIAIMVFSLYGCYYDKMLEETLPEDIVVSYENDIQPIFTKNCTVCHPVLISPPDLTGDNSYNSISNGIYIVPNNLEASLLYQRLLGKPTVMPPNGSLPILEINMVRRWIEQGALNN